MTFLFEYQNNHINLKQKNLERKKNDNNVTLFDFLQKGEKKLGPKPNKSLAQHSCQV